MELISFYPSHALQTPMVVEEEGVEEVVAEGVAAVVDLDGVHQEEEEAVEVEVVDPLVVVSEAVVVAVVAGALVEGVAVEDAFSEKIHRKTNIAPSLVAANRYMKSD